ncbi:MAG: hypothetical protein Q4D20_01715 [Clostridia bacterium]|nr:hypothetical protein [Clostridia bacterium]
MNEKSNINTENVVNTGEIDEQTIGNEANNAKKGKACPNCGCLVSKSADKCPQCGHKLKKKGLKVAIGCVTPLLIIIVLLIVIFARLAVPKTGVIGETYTDNLGIEFKVNAIEFADCIDGLRKDNDNFWLPLTKENYKKYYSNDYRFRNLNYEDYKSMYGLIPKGKKYTLVFISYTAKNVDKEDRTIKEKGFINYDDGYKYDKGSLAWRKSEANWEEIPGGLIVSKLDEESYEFRAYIFIPKKIVESDKSLTYKLFGIEYDLRKTEK